ncbi:MAG: hypothetical protein ACM3X6_02880 [Patescibacteria group bacterium]
MAKNETPPPGELRDVDVQLVSLVSRGANRCKFKIFKQAGEIVAKAVQTALGKESATPPAPPPSFQQRMQAEAAEEATRNGFWAFRSTIEDILRSEVVTDKLAAISATFEEFKTWLLARVTLLGLAKAAEEISDIERVVLEKAGKKISAARLERLKAALAALNEVITEAEADNNPEGGTTVANTEIKTQPDKLDEILKAVQGLASRVETLEKAEEPASGGDPPAGDPPAGDPPPVDETGKKLDEVLKAVTGLAARVETLEKARGGSNRIPESTEVKKDAGDGFWGGVFI